MKNMEITDIRIKKVASEGKMKAVASVTFDNAFAVHDVKVIEGPEKLFLAAYDAIEDEPAPETAD